VAFGYYGIWGVIFFHYLASSLAYATSSPGNLISVIPAFGSPLLLVSWFLLIRFSFEYSKRRFPRRLTFIYFAVALPLLALFLYVIKMKLPAEDFDMDQLYKIVLSIHLSFTFATSIILIFHQSENKIHLSPFILVLSLLIPAISLFVSFVFIPSHWLFAPLFILSYFLAPAFLPAIIYFNIGDFEVRREKISGFEVFCNRFEISKREAEIVEQICKGKTNKEIAESLFITLQTVKDHASRIYLKTEVSNRVQLTNLVRSYLKSSQNQF